MSVCSVALSYALNVDLLDARPSPASISLRASFLKKFQGSGVSKDAKSSALALFKKNNSACKDWTMKRDTLLDEYLLNQVKDQMRIVCDAHVLDLLDANTILSYGRHGPGASVGYLSTDCYTKSYASSLTTTKEGLYDMYYRWCKFDPRREASETKRSSVYGPFMLVQGSTVSVVPKNHDIGRTICTEPSLNMYFQLGIGAILERALERAFGISLSRQPAINKRLARIGSRIMGSFSTIDLSSASDTISIEMVRWLLPRQLFDWLMLTRSPSCKIDGCYEDLHLLSSMGNGYTFPLQTLIFACVVAAVYALDGTPLKKTRYTECKPTASSMLALSIPIVHAVKYRLGNFGVFGDDIVIRVRTDAKVRRLLFLLGFQVNDTKSFREGWFRESCGGDYHRGRDIRGIYIKRLDSKQDCLVAFNACARFSAIHRIDLSTVLSLLLRGTGKFLPVPLDSDFASGHIVPFSLVVKKLRVHETLQCSVYRCWVPVPKRVRFLPDRVDLPNGKSVIYNPDGVLLVALNRCLRGRAVVAGENKYPLTMTTKSGDFVLYTLKTRVHSGWDGHPSCEGRWSGALTKVLSKVLDEHLR